MQQKQTSNKTTNKLVQLTESFHPNLISCAPLNAKGKYDTQIEKYPSRKPYQQQNASLELITPLVRALYSEDAQEICDDTNTFGERDKDSKKIADQFKKKYQDRFLFENKKFSEISKIGKNIKDIKGIIFDLGYSTIQIKDPEKGLSFNSKGKLNMKMGLNNFSADDIINKLGQKELAKIFKIFGEENSGSIISKKIISFRKNKNIQTENLVDIINSVKKKRFSKIHNATKVFQALRIIVNNEISELIYGLINAYNLIPVGGIIAVVTFHSIEDKIVKFFFKNYSEIKNSSRYSPVEENNFQCFNLQNKKPITPSSEEIKINPPSRSAKLRFAVKINNECNFEEFIKKFQNLIDIENLQFDK